MEHENYFKVKIYKLSFIYKSKSEVIVVKKICCFVIINVVMKYLMEEYYSTLMSILYIISLVLRYFCFRNDDNQ